MVVAFPDGHRNLRPFHIPAVGGPGPGITGVQMRKALVLMGAAFFVLCEGPVAHAQGKKAALAKRHFQKAELLYQQGEFQKALDEYKKAMTYKRHPALIFNIAQCYRQLGNHKKALFFYKLFLSELPNASNIKEVLSRIREMEKRIAEAQQKERAKGKVSVITVPDGAELRINKMSGSADGTTPALVALSPGEHLLVLRKPGYQDVQKTVTITSGKIALVRVTLQPLAGRPPPDTRPPPRATRPPPRLTRPRPTEPRPVRPTPRVTPRPVAGTVPVPAEPRIGKPVHKRWWFWTGVGATALLAIGGTVFGAIAVKYHKKWEEDRVSEDRKAGRLAAGLADAFLFTGLAAAVTVTVAAIVVEKRRKAKKKETALIAPTCGPSGCGVFVSGRF